MTDLPTPDPGMQPAGADHIGHAPHAGELPPRSRYHVSPQHGSYRLTLQITDLTPHQTPQLLRAAKQITGGPIPPLQAWLLVDLSHDPSGRQPGQKTGTAPELEIKRLIVQLIDQGWSYRHIARRLNSEYPPEEYGRTNWNHRTAGRWHNECQVAEHKGTEIDDLPIARDNRGT